VKQGDLVKILERTMGVKIDTHTTGMIISESDCFINFWDVLVCGKIKSIAKNALQKL